MTPPRQRGLLVLLPGLCALAALGWLVLARPGAEATRARQASTPFLGPPYYGSHARYSWFDHEYPTYGDPPNCPVPDPNDICGTISREDGLRTPGTLDDCVGQVSCYSGHDGIDYTMVYEPVLAAADGSVYLAGWQNPANHRQGYGLRVRLDHGNGYHTIYGHRSAVIVGQAGGPTVVDRGDQIGTSGTTGSSTGPHLHFEVRHNNIRTDPYGWNAPSGTPDPWETAVTSHDLWLAGTPYPPLSGTPST